MFSGIPSDLSHFERFLGPFSRNLLQWQTSTRLSVQKPRNGFKFLSNPSNASYLIDFSFLSCREVRSVVTDPDVSIYLLFSAI